MKKLEDYKGQKIAIHFPNYELWLRRKEINPEDESLDSDFKDGYFYYDPFENNGKGQSYSTSEGYVENRNYRIFPALNFFLKDEFVFGEYYEFSKNKEIWIKERYLCKSPEGIFLSLDSYNINTYRYARKIIN